MTDTSKSENKPDTAEAKIREIAQSLADDSVEFGTDSMENGGFDEREYAERVEKAVQQLKGLLVEARKAQSAATSDWIEKHIRMLHKDSLFKNVSSSVAFTYAEDQARQGSKAALQQTRQEEVRE